MKKQRTGKKKSPGLTPVRNNETVIDFPGLPAISASAGTRTINGSRAGDRGVNQPGHLKPKENCTGYRVPDTVKVNGDLLGAAEIFKMVDMPQRGGEIKKWGRREL